MPPRKDLLFVSTQLVLLALFLVEVAALRFPLPEWLRWLGAGLALIGGGWSLVAVLQLRTSLTPWPTPKAGGKLVTTGVYAYSRHPIYGGLLLGALGASLYLASGFHLVVTAALYALFYYKSGYEERLLRAVYPGYSDYAAGRRRF